MAFHRVGFIRLGMWFSYRLGLGRTLRISDHINKLNRIDKASIVPYANEEGAKHLMPGQSMSGPVHRCPSFNLPIHDFGKGHAGDTTNLSLLRR